MMKNLRYNNILLRVLTILCLMMASVGAWAADYVFMSNGYYMTVNNGTFARTNTFNPATCIWTLDGNNNLSINIGGTRYYFGYTRTGQGTRQSPWGYSNWGLVTGDTKAAITINGTSASCTVNTRANNNGTGYTYYIRYANNNFQFGNTNSNLATAYEVTTTDHPATGGITITANPATINDVNGTSNLQTNFTNYTQHYVTYRFNNANHNWYGNADHGNTAPTPLYSLDGSTYNWTMTNAGTNATLNPYSAYSAGLTYSTASATDRVVTVKLTASNATYDFNQEATAAVTLKAVAAAPQFVGLYNIVSNRNTAYYVTVSPDNFYNGNAATPNLIDIQQPDIWALYSYNGEYYLQHASDGKWAVSNRDGNGDYAVHIQEYANPVNNATLWNISDLNAATQTIQPSTNAALFWNAYGNVGNSVGYYSNDDGSKWKFLPVNSISAPTIAISNGGQVTLSHEMRSATIYYTTDGSTPTTASTRYTGQFNVANGTTVKAIAVLGTLTSAAAERLYKVYATPVAITSLDQITDPYGAYILTVDVDASGSTTIANFYGSFDGDYHVITGLDHPIFGTLNGAEVKNIIVDNVSITGETVGAIAGVADNGSRIYNCGVLATGTDFSDVFDKPYTSSSTISGNSTNGAVGSIVGRLRGNSRVANCFSYADITSGRFVGGIVGDWEGTWYNGNGASGNMVANCMFYGNLTGGSRSPIVNSNATAIGNDYSLYSYFRYKSMTTTTFTRQNGALAAQEDIWLKRFKFFQAAVTNHRDMAAYYIFGEGNTENTAKMAQWYIDETIAPWPILRKAGARKSTLDRVIPNTSYANEGNLITNGKILRDHNDGTIADADVTQRYNMNVGTNGMLRVNFNISGTGVASGGQTYSVDLPITDMDHEHFDYTWGKVVLPFANEFDGWAPDYDYICTGWEISSVDATGKNGFTDYNFADRDCTAKDIYDAANNPIIFAQGGNWIVPYGVTSVNIKAHFARAYYLADATYDRAAGGGNTHGGNRPNTYHGKTVYTSAAGAWGAMTAQTLPHSQALVLVGNYHYNQNTSGNHTGKGCTIMSVDEDKDQQPDYGWYTSVGDYRQNWMPMRWDFIPMIGAGMTQIFGSMPPGIAIPVAKGWLEMTETSLCRTFEFEVSDGLRTNADDGHSNNAYIINGGWFQQIVRCFTNSTNNTKHSYMKIGGNAFVQEYFHGNHSGAESKYNLRPMNLTGGEVVKCFMTGLKYSTTDFILADNNGQNMRFYCAGGKIDKYISCYMEHPVQDATMKVDHAYINRFFGGGTTSKAEVKGNIDITMDNSYVNFFCGGPEFGDMAANKNVTVNTTGSIFGEYYGAGFGGTELTRISNGDGKNDHYDAQRLSYNAGNGGFEVSYEMEALLNGSGAALFRYYDYRAALSMATAGTTTTTANNCLFLNSFYGGGCQGKVDGAITSTLNNCDVKASAFGGGFKAAATTIDVYPTGGYAWHEWDGTYKAFSNPTYPNPVQFTWAAGTAGTSNEGNKVLYTNADMSQMGRVTGAISITVNGGTVGQNVYGGGNESPSDRQTNVTITGGARIIGDVYGGANQANVGDATVVDILAGTAKNVFGANNVSGTKSGSVTVNIKETTADKPVIINNNVYGGGNLADYTGTPVVNMMAGRVVGSVFGGGLSAEVDGDTHVNVTGGTVSTAVYGGGALANISGNAVVNLFGGTINDVFGGGLGRQAVAADPEHGIAAVAGIAAEVGGNTTVTLGNPADLTKTSIVTGSIFGANNLNGTPLGHALVRVVRTERKGGDDEDYHVLAVYGGGNQSAYEPTNANDFAEVIVENCDNSIEYVYGGGNAAPVPATQVTIWGADAIGNVFGGGNGAGEIAPGVPNPGANVGYKADNTTTYGLGTAIVNIYGGTIHSAFGGSNTKGLIRVSANVNLDEQAQPDKEQCPLILDEVYGAGNEAEMYASGTLNLGCITGLSTLYGGAKNADYHADVTLNITSGTFGKIFGGNNLGGTLDGSININIDETGCHPVVIDQLYACGNLADYTTPADKAQPTINIISCTSIGSIFGAGLGDLTGLEEKATVTGSPIVNINQIPGRYAANIDADGDGEADGDDNLLGAIGTVYGGGNAAKVIGETYVNVGTAPTNTHLNGGWDTTSAAPVKAGANITGNVYGGGNKADVTSKTNVTIGR